MGISHIVVGFMKNGFESYTSVIVGVLFSVLLISFTAVLMLSAKLLKIRFVHYVEVTVRENNFHRKPAHDLFTVICSL